MKKGRLEKAAKIDMIINILLIVGTLVYKKEIASFLLEKMYTPIDFADFNYVLGIVGFWLISQIIYFIKLHKKKEDNILRYIVFISIAGKIIVVLVLGVIGIVAILYDGPRTNLLM